MCNIPRGDASAIYHKKLKSKGHILSFCHLMVQRYDDATKFQVSTPFKIQESVMFVLHQLKFFIIGI